MAKHLSYYSEVRIFSENGEKLIEKSYPLSFLSRPEIEDLAQRMTIARDAFEEMHIPISQLKSMEILKDRNSFKINVIEKFEGQDFVDVVNEDNFEMYMERMLSDIYKPLLSSTTTRILPVGIDTSIRNCVYRSHSGEFCYVDFMPPKVYYKGSYTQEVPEVVGPFHDIRMLCHNDRTGIIYALYINLARKYPSKRRMIISKLEQFADQLNSPELKHYIAESPFYRVAHREHALRIVQDMDSWLGVRYWQLREASVIAAEMNTTFRPELEDFFKLTHPDVNPDSDEYGLLPEKRFQEAKIKLIQAFTQK